MDEYLTPADRRAVRRIARYGAGWIIVVLLFITAIGWGFWALGVASSDVRGAGNAIKAKNTATNRIAAQERFEQRFADIEAAGQRVQTLAAGAKANPEDYTLQVQATGSVTFCQQLVADYNADARKYSARDFRAADLPDHINAGDACKEHTP